MPIRYGQPRSRILHFDEEFRQPRGALVAGPERARLPLIIIRHHLRREPALAGEVAGSEIAPRHQRGGYSNWTELTICSTSCAAAAPDVAYVSPSIQTIVPSTSMIQTWIVEFSAVAYRPSFPLASSASYQR
jgi:hypothetical protein